MTSAGLAESMILNLGRVSIPPGCRPGCTELHLPMSYLPRAEYELCHGIPATSDARCGSIWRMRVTLLFSFVVACSGATSPPVESTSSTSAPEADQPVNAEPRAETEEREQVPAAATLDFDSGNMRCMHVAPEGELLSCEEISQDGVDEASARANCRMLSSELEVGTCPTDTMVGRCLAMDGPDLEPRYPIMITHYVSTLVPSAERSAELCGMLNGTVVPAPWV